MHVRPISIPRSTSPHAAAPAQQLRRTIACTLKFFVLPLSKYPLLPTGVTNFSFLTDLYFIRFEIYSYSIINIQWFFRRMEGRALVDLRSDTVRLCVTPCALAWARRSPLLSAPACSGRRPTCRLQRAPEWGSHSGARACFTRGCRGCGRKPNSAASPQPRNTHTHRGAGARLPAGDHAHGSDEGGDVERGAGRRRLRRRSDGD
jgi:hypothetical protein